MSEKSTIRKIAGTVLLGVLATACQEGLDTKQYLSIKMLGSLVAPDDATGSFNPIWQQYSLEGVFLTPDPETDETLSLFAEDPIDFKIIDRSQIIYKKEIDGDWVGENFDSLVARFNTSVTAAGKYRQDYELALDSSDIGYFTQFEVEKGQGITMVIQVQWKDTVTRNVDDDPPSETWTLPNFDVSVATD